MDRGFSSSAVYPGSRELMSDDLRDSHLVALHQVIQAIARQLDTRETLPLIAAKARALTGAESTTIVLLDSSRSYLDFVAVAGSDASDMVGQRVLVDDAVLGHTALTGEIYVAENLILDQPLLPSLDPEHTMSFGVRSAAVVPIFLSGSSVGALAAINRTEAESFSGVDVLRLQMFASAAAIALGQERMRLSAMQQERERKVLLDAARAGSSSLNVQDVLQSVLATLGVSMEMSAAIVYLLNDERNRLYIAADVGLAEEERDSQLAADEGWVAQVLSGASPRCIRDTDGPELFDMMIPGVRSVIIAPLVSRATAEGLIVVGSRLPGGYSQQDAEMLAAVANHAMISLENAWLFEDATRRAQEATAIYELSQSVGATLQLDRVLNFVADSVLALLQVDKFALFLFNPRSERLEIKTARNLSAEVVLGMQPRVGEGIAGWVMEFETPTAVQDVAADHRNRSMPIDDAGVTSLVSVPLQVGDKVIGVLHAMSSRRRLFTVGEMELLYTIANQVAAAIVNAQRFEAAQQQKAELRKSIRRVARALGSSTDLGKSSEIIADLGIELVEADRSLLYTIEPESRVVLRAASNFKSAQQHAGGPVSSHSPAAFVARSRRSLMIEDVAADGRFVWPDYVSRERVGSYLGVPLKLGKDTIGVLEVYSRAMRKFAADEVRSLLTFASQASVGLKNAQLVEQASRRLRDLEALNTISSGLYGRQDVDVLCSEALTLLSRATHSDVSLMNLFGDPDRRIMHHGVSAATAEVEGESTALGAALVQLAGWVREYGSATQLPRPGSDSADVNALAVPVRRGDSGDVLGAIIVCRVAPAGEYDSHDRRFIETAANLLAARLGG